MRRRRARALLPLLLPLLPMLLLGGCHWMQSPLAPAGDQSAALHRLFVLMMAVCGPVYLLVIAGLGWSVWRARKETGVAPPGSAPDAAVDRRLDKGVWAAAALIVAGLTVLIVGSFLADRALFATRGSKALDVRVTGHQWWWRIEYRDPASGRLVETANELHLPQNLTTRLQIVSADVIHSFWVPTVAGKIDMVPGRRNLLDVTPRRAGWYRGQCAEFCGLQHAHMALDVKVESPEEFRAWLAAQAKPSAGGGKGKAVFVGACGTCHAVRGTPANGRAGPDLTHLAQRRSIAAGAAPMGRGSVQAWLAQPQVLKPGTSMPTVPLAPADADAVADYLVSLR